MSIIKNLILILFSFLIINHVNAEEIKKILKNKDWETYVVKNESGKICFAQSMPILQAPKTNPREARLFVTFRSVDKIKDEVSVTAGYVFNNKNKVTAKSGKTVLIFSTVQENFAWFKENKTEKKLIKVLKKGSRLMVAGYNIQGSQTIDHYSLLGFTKAYSTAKKSCS